MTSLSPETIAKWLAAHADWPFIELEWDGDETWYDNGVTEPTRIAWYHRSGRRIERQMILTGVKVYVARLLDEHDTDNQVISRYGWSAVTAEFDMWPNRWMRRFTTTPGRITVEVEVDKLLSALGYDLRAP